MPNKSRVQCINRGRIGKPRWTVEIDGKFICSDPSKSRMMGMTKTFRRHERAGTLDSLQRA